MNEGTDLNTQYDLELQAVKETLEQLTRAVYTHKARSGMFKTRRHVDNLRRLNDRLGRVLGFADMLNNYLEVGVQDNRNRAGRLAHIYSRELDELDGSIRGTIKRLVNQGDARAAEQVFESLDDWKNGRIEDGDLLAQVNQAHADWRRRAELGYPATEAEATPAGARANERELPKYHDDDDEIGPS